MAKHKKFHLGIKGLIKNKEGKILFLLKSPNRTKNYGREPYWNIPGGRIEQGDSIVFSFNTLSELILRRAWAGEYFFLVLIHLVFHWHYLENLPKILKHKDNSLYQEN